jgi:RNase adaptor protein for sRNA GlmZ degradation
MSARDQFDDELATRYAQARRQRPDADEQQLTEVIVASLSDDEMLRYAAEALVWEAEPAGRRELATSYVQKFVLAMETDSGEGRNP